MRWNNRWPSRRDMRRVVQINVAALASATESTVPPMAIIIHPGQRSQLTIVDVPTLDVPVTVQTEAVDVPAKQAELDAAVADLQDENDDDLPPGASAAARAAARAAAATERSPRLKQKVARVATATTEVNTERAKERAPRRTFVFQTRPKPPGSSGWFRNAPVFVVPIDEQIDE